MTDIVDQLIKEEEEEIIFDDDTMLDMLIEEPEQACAIVWASARSLCAEAEEEYPDLHNMPEELKNAYIVAAALDMVVQGLQEMATEYTPNDSGGLH
jgi:hypothetical protein